MGLNACKECSPYNCAITFNWFNMLLVFCSKSRRKSEVYQINFVYCIFTIFKTKNHILRFNISMDESGFMQILKSVHLIYIYKYRHQRIFRIWYVYIMCFTIWIPILQITVIERQPNFFLNVSRFWLNNSKTMTQISLLKTGISIWGKPNNSKFWYF